MSIAAASLDRESPRSNQTVTVTAFTFAVAYGRLASITDVAVLLRRLRAILAEHGHL